MEVVESPLFRRQHACERGYCGGGNASSSHYVLFKIHACETKNWPHLHHKPLSTLLSVVESNDVTFCRRETNSLLPRPPCVVLLLVVKMVCVSSLEERSGNCLMQMLPFRDFLDEFGAVLGWLELVVVMAVTGGKGPG